MSDKIFKTYEEQISILVSRGINISTNEERDFALSILSREGYYNTINGYKKLFPSHLKDDADRMCHIMFIGLFTKVIDYGIKNRLIAPPSEDYVCDVLIEYR